jgi:tRNA wybutosine-synthesizing protein 4
MATRTLARFGASISQQSNQAFITGGIIRDNLIPVDEDICIVTYGSSNGHTMIKTIHVEFGNAEPRPMLIGSTTFLSSDKLLIMGGGSVCFSFGTFWNRGCYTLLVEGSKAIANAKEDRQAIEEAQPLSWKFKQTVGFASSGKSTEKRVNTSCQNIQRPPEPIPVMRVKVSSDFDFSAIMSAARPVIIEGLDLGTCTASWSSEYLMDRIGQDREV